MPAYIDHIAQGRDNLEFLLNVNSEFPAVYDWQVTITFYTALHFINGHVKKAIGLHYTTHRELANAISPYSQPRTPAQLDKDTFVSYEKLFILSRRSRYLYQRGNKKAKFTYDKHLAKAVYHLDQVMKYMDTNYQLKFSVRDFNSKRLKSYDLNYFKAK